MLEELKRYATDHHVPIIQDESMLFIANLIQKNKIRRILEIGSAIGYSAIRMALIDKEIKIVTLEHDIERSMIAKQNIDNFGLSSQISLIEMDASLYETDQNFDLVFIDAAKGKNQLFFDKFKDNLSNKGFIITDNMLFHGLVENIELCQSKRLRKMVEKIIRYREYLESLADYKTEFYNIGDGISVTYRRNDENENISNTTE